MAISINLGSGAGSTNGDTLYDAFTKINTMFSTTSKLDNGDLTINDVRIGKANSYGSTAVGEFALNVNTSSGLDNTAVGWSALASNTSGDYNTAVGNQALSNNITGICNTAVGNTALLGSNADANTAVGYASLLNNSSGTFNTAVGHFSLNVNSIRSNNTAIGKYALSTNTLYSNCTGLGANASFLNGDNQVQLGDSSTTTYVYNTVNSRSDLRDKTEVRNTVLGLDFINELRPVDYKWDMREDYRAEKPAQGELSDEDFKILIDEWLESCKVENLNHDGTHTRTRYHHGLIAQEVQDVIEASGVDFGGFQDHKVNGGGDVLSLGYTELIAPMIKAIQELKAEIELLKNK